MGDNSITTNPFSGTAPNGNGFPLFTVAILHYKQPEYWQEAILSVIAQDYPAIQLVFSDDGSPNFDARVVEQFIQEHRTPSLVDVRVCASPMNQGTAANCDSAVANSSGEYLLLLDGDDMLADSAVLTRFAEMFRQLPDDANIVTANCLLCDEKQENGVLRYTPEMVRQLNERTAEQQYQSLYLWCFPVPSATAFKRRVFSQCGGFQAPYVRLCQDGYFYIHLVRLGQKFHVAEFVGCKHRRGGMLSPGKNPFSVCPSGIRGVCPNCRDGDLPLRPSFFPGADGCCLPAVLRKSHFLSVEVQRSCLWHLGTGLFYRKGLGGAQRDPLVFPKKQAALCAGP